MGNKKGILLGCGGLLILGIVILLFSGIGSYNKLVEQEQSVNGQWAQVENQYQRRTDLIPNLVNTVKGYAAHEQKTLTDVINARSRATSINLTPEALNDPKALQQFDKVQGELSSALSRLMVVSEAYPNLKANENFRDLQVQLEGTENRISRERQKFNEVVQGYNVSVRRFPGNIYAGIFGFSPKTYFAAQPGSETAPKVEF